MIKDVIKMKKWTSDDESSIYKPNILTWPAFHGTVSRAYKKIVQDRHFSVRPRKNHWLGNGVYFFLNDRDKAKWWSKNTLRLLQRDGENPNEKPFIIQCQISLYSDKLLDLDTETDQRKLQNFIEDLDNDNIEIISDECLDNHEAMCVLIDYYSEIENFDAIKYTFKSDYHILSGKLGIENHGQQLSVYNQKIINFDTMEGVEVDD